jgi:hypothetical protein
MSENVRPNEGAQDRAALVLAGGGTQLEAATAAQVDARTIRRWLDDPTFAALVKTIRGEAFDQALAVLVAGATEAARHLVALATERHSNAGVRLGACRSVLQFAADHISAGQLEDRIAALEDPTLDLRIMQLIGETERRARFEASQ